MEIPSDVQPEAEGVDAVQMKTPGQADLVLKQEVLQRYRDLLAKDPRNVVLLNQVGQAAEEVGDNDRALWAYRRAIRLDLGYEISYRNLGLLYRKEGREGPAVEALQKYVQWAGEEADLTVVQDTLDTTTGEDEIQPAQILADAPIYDKLNKVWKEMDLTPAEAMMLLDPDESSGLEMMQYTLIDLVAQGVLEADDRLRIGRGEGYSQSNLAPHEALFAKYFSRISDYVDVDKLARAALAELDDDGDVYKAAYVRGSLLDKGYLEIETKRIAGLLPVQQVVPSRKGALAKNRLKRLLREADGQLARSLANNPDQARAYVDKGGPALLLMDAYPSATFKNWHEMLTRMGFGPAIERLKTKAGKSDLGAYVDDILRMLTGA